MYYYLRFMMSMYGREAYIKMWIISQLVDSMERNGTRAFVEVAFSIVACQKVCNFFFIIFFFWSPWMA